MCFSYSALHNRHCTSRKSRPTMDLSRRNQASGYTGRGRSGLPEEVANVALFLVSDETSYVSGAVYSITGG